MKPLVAGTPKPKTLCRNRIAKVCRSILVCCALALVIAAAPAPTQTWVPVGAPGGNVRALAQDPRDPERIYLGTADGILYRSDDGGLGWHRLNPGFPLRGSSLDEIVVDPNGIVFVGYWEVHSQGGGVARSIDRGQTFTLLKGIQGESVRALALAPSDPRIIAAGTLSGVFLSKDGGRSWTRITPKGHRDLRNIESLAFDASDPGVLYAGTWHLVWKTLNAGGTWFPAHDGMIDDSDVMTLTVEPRDPMTIYATACSGIYRSMDGARHWTKLGGIPYSSRRTRAFALGVEDEDLLLAGTTEGFWASEDGGETWSGTTTKELVVNAVVALPGDAILLGTEEAGVLRSSNGGHTWVASNNGFSERFVFRLLLDPAGQRWIAAIWGARFGGVFVSPGVGGPWVRLGRSLGGRQVLSLALLDETILAGTDDGIFSWAPESSAWVRVSTRLDGREIHPRVTELAVLPSHRILAGTSKGVILSQDGGLTWTQPVLGRAEEISGLAVPRDDLDLVVAGTPSGFFRSEDGGETWKQVSTSLGVEPHALAFVPHNSRILFATTSGGLFRSGDHGATWRRVSGGIPQSDLTGIALSPDGRTVYVSDFTWGGVFRSVDGGLTWQRMPTDGLGSDRVWALSLDPTAPGRVLASSSAGGLHALVTKPAGTRRL
jgi:photosystem II stability/assembly factor-like uncharacterized protein